MTTIKLRRGTAAQWVSAATVLAAGEPGVETDTGIYKVGDGSTAWASLPVSNSGTFAGKYLDGQAQWAGRSLALGTFYSALLNRAASPCNIVFFGDSITEGEGATARTKRWQTLVRDRLRTLFPVPSVTGGDNYVPVYNETTTIGQPATVTGSLAKNTGFGLGGRSYQYTASSSNFVTWTVTGSAVDIMHAGGASTGTAYVKVDGGGATTWSTTNAGGNKDGIVHRETFGSTGSHTVEVGWSSGGIIIVDGLIVYNGDETTGVRCYDAGHFGWKSNDAATAWSTGVTVGGQTPGKMLAWQMSTIAPSLVVIEFGANDLNQNVVPATYQANIQSAITTIKAGAGTPSFLLVGVPKRTGTYTYAWSQYVAAMQAICAADSTVTYLDLGARMGDVATDTFSLYDGSVHFVDKGHALAADLVTSFLMPTRVW